ncbi:hypothetical protein LTR16_001449, partial [Cryomyces antarcticus]
MVDNAGIAIESHSPLPIWAVPQSTWAATLAINPTGVFLGCKFAAAQTIRQAALAPGADRGPDRQHGQRAGPGGVAKGAVMNLTRARRRARLRRAAASTGESGLERDRDPGT